MFLCCPLCGSPAEAVQTLNFAERGALPTSVVMALCRTCDFAFTCPRPAAAYESYYDSIVSDRLGHECGQSPGELARYSAQADILATIIDSTRPLRILDFGCGQGGLLRCLSQRYPHHQFFAFEPNQSTHADQIPHVQRLTEIAGEFDLVIASHVLEHIIDVRGVAKVMHHLADGGRIYIEVPDGCRYDRYARREWMYYVDRLHVNHFSNASMHSLVHMWGLVVKQAGTLEFAYKDGSPYPALYVIAGIDSTQSSQKAPQLTSPCLSNSITRYVAQEQNRALCLSEALPQNSGVVVYGFGDNFFRLRSTGGPLHGRDIIAVVDQRCEELQRSQWAEMFTFIDPALAVRRYRDECFVVTLSWSGEAVHDDLQRQGVSRIVLM